MHAEGLKLIKSVYEGEEKARTMTRFRRRGRSKYFVHEEPAVRRRGEQTCVWQGMHTLDGQLRMFEVMAFGVLEIRGLKVPSPGPDTTSRGSSGARPTKGPIGT